MLRAPSTLPPLSPLSKAMVPYRPRASSSTPTLARKRSLGMLREMSPAVSPQYQNRLTRFSSLKTGSPRNLQFQGPASLPLDSDIHLRFPPSQDLEELPPLDPCRTSPWHLPIVARGSDEPRRQTTIVEVETSDRGNLEKVQLVHRRPHYPFPPSQLRSWSPPQPSTISSMLCMFRTSTLRKARATRIKRNSSKSA